MEGGTRGKSRGRVYDTGDLAANYCQGMSSLTQSSFVASTTDYSAHVAQEERLQNEVNEGKEEARTTKEETRMTKEIARQLQDHVKLMQQQLATMMERQLANTLTSTS